MRLEYGELRLLILERWVVWFRAASLPFVWVVIPLSLVELCILGQPVKFAGCLPPQLIHFGGGAGRFWAIFRCVLLIAFYALGGAGCRRLTSVRKIDS